jgi:pyruvate/2-oxoglutarate dehydrogenase complex dihydrolipoamide acyltransferase (E2) component
MEMRLPKLGAGVDKGIIIAWLIKEGQKVRKGEPVMQIETDKAIGEVESPLDGEVIKLMKPEGSEVAVGEFIALIQ